LSSDSTEYFPNMKNVDIVVLLVEQTHSQEISHP
jgi:hypothetical protein